MFVRRIPTHRAVIGMIVVLACCQAGATDPDPRPLAPETPAFQAPEEPPESAVAPETRPEPAALLSQENALALALMQNPELAMFSWETRAAEARTLQAGVVPNPELELRYWRFDKENRNLVKSDSSKRAILSQEFETGGKRRRRTELALVDRRLAGWDYEAKRIEVISRVTARFAAVLGAQRRVQSLREFVEFYEEMRDRVSALVESGTIGSLEVHRVGRQVGLARIDLQAAERRLSAARLDLTTTWGNPSPRFTEALGDLERIEPIPDIDTVRELALQSPALARFETERLRGEAALALAKANKQPNVTYSVGLRWEHDFSARDYLLDFEVDLPFYDRKKGDIREARYNMAKIEAARKAAEAESSRGIAEFYYDLAESRDRSLTLRDEVVPAARAMFDSFALIFDSSAGYLDDLLDARRDLADAEVQYVDALVEYHQNSATLEGLIGHGLPVGE